MTAGRRGRPRRTGPPRKYRGDKANRHRLAQRAYLERLGWIERLKPAPSSFELVNQARADDLLTKTRARELAAPAEREREAIREKHPERKWTFEPRPRGGR